MPWIIRDGQPVKVGPEVDTRITAPEVTSPQLTPKQALQREAELLGIEFTDRTTIAELERLIAEHSTDEE